MVVTGSEWLWTDDGPLRSADILMGETYDATRWGRPVCQPSESCHLGATLAYAAVVMQSVNMHLRAVNSNAFYKA